MHAVAEDGHGVVDAVAGVGGHGEGIVDAKAVGVAVAVSHAETVHAVVRVGDIKALETVVHAAVHAVGEAGEGVLLGALADLSGFGGIASEGIDGIQRIGGEPGERVLWTQVSIIFRLLGNILGSMRHIMVGVTPEDYPGFCPSIVTMHIPDLI